jgi:hypothetical protein
MAEEKKAPPKSIVKIQAWDGDWQMSEDLVVKVDLGTSLTKFIEYIATLRNISTHRIKIRLPNGVIAPSDRMQWALRRHGIQAESTVRVEPSRPGAWQWYDEEYYERKLVTEVMDVLRERRGEAILIDDLLKLVVYPPCYKTTFRVFLRRFPDQLRFRSDITTNNIYVCINEGFQILTYERIPQQLGRIKQYEPPDDEYWVDFSDVDSMNPVESDLVLPTLNYQVGIMGGTGFGCESAIKNTNPFVVLLVDGKYIGCSAPRLGTRAPLYENSKLEVPFPYNTNFKKAFCVRFEVWNLNMAKHEATCRQFCEIEGQALLDFFEPELVGDYYKTYTLISTDAEEERRAAEEKRLEEAEAAYLLKEILLMELEDGRKEALDIMFEEDRIAAEKQKAEDEALYGKSEDALRALDAMDDGMDDEDIFGKKTVKKTPEQQAYDVACLKTSTLSGHLHLRGSKSILQIQVRGCYELWSHDSDDSCEVNPFVVVVWNGLDVGDTEKRKLTRWPSWDNAVFDIPCPGNMEINQCFLEIQVWNRNTGLDKYMMSSLTMTSRMLKEYILHVPGHAHRKAFELKVPDQEVITDEGEVTKIKSKQKGGFVNILAGPVGLPEKNLKPYQIEIIVGGAMARTEVYCVLFWNSVEFGRTDNAPSVTEKISKNTEKVTWTWKKNKFIFTMTDKEKMVKGELKIDCYDPTTKGINSFFGSIIVEKEELTDFLNQDFATQRSFTCRKDPKRNDKEQKINRGTLSLKGGELGARVETERLIEIRSCMSLLGARDVLEHDTNPPMCYVDAYWGTSSKPVLCGRTNPKPNDLNPFWEATDNRWVIPKDCKPSGLYYANIVLKFEVWEGLPDQDNDQKILLGVCSITQNQLMDFAEAKVYTEMELPLVAATDKAKKTQPSRIGGSLFISTPGIKVKHCFVHVKKEEEELKEYLDTYIDRKGAANLFEWSNREKYKGK